MKKFFTIIIATFAISLQSYCCDICGCGIGNNYVGILPDFQKNIIGLRYRYIDMLSHVGVGGARTYLTTQEQYNNMELWGSWTLRQRFRIQGVMPYNYIQRNNNGSTVRKNGLGDMVLNGYFNIINKRTTINEKHLLAQSLWAGGGVKLPTGKYTENPHDAIVENGNLFQLGTGSFDFNISAMYDLRLQDVGLNINANYKINTSNRYQYRYGNKSTLSGQFYYKVALKNNINITPNIGMQYDRASIDTKHAIEVAASGGSITFGTVGIESMLGNWAAGANFQTPLHQKLANGIIKANNKLMFHVALTF